MPSVLENWKIEVLICSNKRFFKSLAFKRKRLRKIFRTVAKSMPHFTMQSAAYTCLFHCRSCCNGMLSIGFWFTTLCDVNSSHLYYVYISGKFQDFFIHVWVFLLFSFSYKGQVCSLLVSITLIIFHELVTVHWYDLKSIIFFPVF